MAIAALPTRVLRDSAIDVVRFSGEKLPEGISFSTPFFICLLYWMVWLTALLTALYMAVLDFRFIRLQYAIEKQILLRQSLGDEFAESLLRKKNGS